MLHKDGILRAVFTGPIILTIFLTIPNVAFAYIGPGAGFAVAGSGLVFLASIGMFFATIIVGPCIWALRWIRGRKAAKKARAKRVVIVGLDGLDPELVDSFIAEGALPNLSALQKEGGYKRLKTTLPALSPVAWSSFQTGVNPGAHNIFDFITRDKRTCLPLLSSTKTESNKIKLLRGSQPFWKILGKHGIFSNIVRVPVSYPPEEFFGTILSGMCTPDLRGSQGTFMFFSSSDKHSVEFTEGTGGEFHTFNKVGNQFYGFIEGPLVEDTRPPSRAKIEFHLSTRDEISMDLVIQKKIVRLYVEKLSEWVPIEFTVKRKKIPGIVRFCLRKAGDDCALYISPVNVNPEKPILPISSPRIFSTWLAKKQGYFGTLGLLEDTWGRNERALDDGLFLKQAYDTHDERVKMFFSALEQTRQGLCVGVFDASDRIQHMFWRYLDPNHPSPKESDEYTHTIRRMYEKMDALVGDIRAKLSPKDWLFVMSDHGFASFRRGVNLNAWLKQEGYLVLKENATGNRDYLQDVDWGKTKAYAIGLAGLFINKKGRERVGIVEEAEYQRLKQEIASKLEKITDPESKGPAIKRVYDTAKEYSGIYAAEAPDLIVGYYKGYRVSWESVTGKLEPTIFTDNVKAWSGDHHIDPELVPGILFSNRPFTEEIADIRDMAPTVLNIFGVSPPRYMEGTVIQ